MEGKALHASYWRNDGATAVPASGLAAGKLHIITSGGQTYAQGPLPLPGAELPGWYALDGQKLPGMDVVYTLPFVLDKLFNSWAQVTLSADGSETLGGARCARYVGDEDAAPRMIGALEPMVGQLPPMGSIRDHFARKGTRLAASEAAVVICPDGLVHEIRATFTYQFEDRPDETRLTLTIRLSDLGAPVSVEAPAKAWKPGERTLAEPLWELPTPEDPEAATLISEGRAKREAGDAQGAIGDALAALERDPAALCACT